MVRDLFEGTVPIAGPHEMPGRDTGELRELSADSELELSCLPDCPIIVDEGGLQYTELIELLDGESVKLQEEPYRTQLPQAGIDPSH